MKYIITYENAHWCGGELHVVVNAAESAEDAEIQASDWMEETQRELFSTEYDEQENEGADYSDECAYTINSVEILDVNNEHWKFYTDPSQSSFYPEL